MAGFQETFVNSTSFLSTGATSWTSRGSMRCAGGIVDVFPFVGENPLRIEFFEDEVESIREFDVGSQRSIRASGHGVACARRDGHGEVEEHAQERDVAGLSCGWRAPGLCGAVIARRAVPDALGTSARPPSRYHTRDRFNGTLALFPQLQCTALRSPPDRS